MSGCSDVCLDHDYDGNNAFYAEKYVKARKAHKCCECGKPIAIGETYQRATGMSDGAIFTERTCEDCTDIRKSFVCGGWMFGSLWGSIREGMFPVWRRVGPWDCLAKLTRETARDACRKEFAEWASDNYPDDTDTSTPAAHA